MGLFSKKTPQPAAPAPVVPIPAPVQVPRWDGARFKIQLRMGRTRIEVQRTKRENSIISNRRAAAEHLRSGKDELARIFAEKTLRERFQMEAYDVVMTYVELLIESAQFIGNLRGFESAQPDVKESVASLVYATQRMSVAELRVAADMLRSHFGAGTIDPIARGDEGPFLHCVNRLLAIKLDSTSPDPALVREELIRIAAEHNIDWTAPPDTYGAVQPPFNPNPFAYPGAGGGYPGAGGGYPGAPPPPNAPPPGDFSGGYGGGGGGGGGGYAYPGHNTAATVDPAAIPGMPPPPPPASVPYLPPPQAPPAFAPSAAHNAPIYPTQTPQAYAPAPPPPPTTGPTDSDDFMTRFNNLKNN